MKKESNNIISSIRKNTINIVKRNYELFVAILVVVVLFFCSLIGWLYYVSTFHESKIGWDYQSFSPWGDSFAPFNVIISFLSVIGLVATIYFQIKNNREQSDNSEKQWRLSYKQNFDNNFYSFLSALNEMKGNIHKKEEALLSARDTINHEMCPIGPFGRPVEKELEEEVLDNIREKLFTYTTTYSTRFISTTNIIFLENVFLQMKKIYNDDFLDDLEKEAYMGILFSHLGKESLMLVGLYAIKKDDLQINIILMKNSNIKYFLLHIDGEEMISKLMVKYYKEF